jgi:translation elongation factor EF-G
VVGGTVPRQYWPAVEKGVRQVLSGGAVAGYPMTGIRCVLYDGKYHDVDSKEIAFITAGKKAFIEAVAKAKPKLLEPYAKVEITVPSKYMGDIAGHLSTKRGRVQDTQMMSGRHLRGDGDRAVGRVAELLERVEVDDRGKRVIRDGLQPRRGNARDHPAAVGRGVQAAA